MWSSLQISLTIALTTERNFCQERNVKLDNVLKKKTEKGKTVISTKTYSSMILVKFTHQNGTKHQVL